MKPNRGVVAVLDRSLARCPVNVSGSDVPLKVLDVPTATVPRGSTLALHSAVWSTMEWKYTNGLCRVAYWSDDSAISPHCPCHPRSDGRSRFRPTGRRVHRLAVGSLPMSSAYSRQEATCVEGSGG